MKRQENQAARLTAGSFSVPLFNQKKRNRVPLTSVPSENEFFSHSEYMASTSSAVSHNAAGTFGCYQASGPSSGVPQSQEWNRQSNSKSAPAQQYGSSRPAPGPAPPIRAYGHLSHPYKAGGRSPMTGQPSNPLRQQDSNSVVNFRQNKYQAPRGIESGQSQPAPRTGLSQMVSPPERPSANAAQPQKDPWKFTNSFEPLRCSFEGKRSSNPQHTVRPTPTQETFSVKPAVENSLRILTAVIDGMRHWSQFKDRVPYLFEIFATLDSAVTVGRYGAKNFLLRDGKEVVQCAFYENEQALPRLIRGQVHRCVGNYDRSRDVLMCVSVRAALPSELRNAQEAVKVCDAEMRALAKSLSEV
ncbi:spermatogenesis-associated protein 22 isoform X2 [Archocentrus centrarchus]|uniref:spermatogenesis-associated protein 22 isoform X2 n=1 Tax=Archocentrus centrarchus TaxID=63155 RepID=UPI0011E9D57F|nr:spermatogenesis-associated protein 22 isoform X2 [Archocentrus centrarchus]